MMIEGFPGIGERGGTGKAALKRLVPESDAMLVKGANVVMRAESPSAGKIDLISQSTPYADRIEQMKTVGGYDPDCGIPAPGRPIYGDAETHTSSKES